MTNPEPTPVPPPEPHVPGNTEDARRWAMITHLSALVGLLGNGIGFLLGPLIVWLWKKEEFPIVDEHGKEAVNFQLTMLIAAVIGFVLSFVLIGIPILIAVAIAAIVFPIIAGLKANEGKSYRYPFTIRMIK